jgi:hypothetical protein
VTCCTKPNKREDNEHSDSFVEGKTCFGAVGAVLCRAVLFCAVLGWVGLAVPCWDCRYDRSALQARNTKKVAAGTGNIIKISW